ncbi:16S rRNA (guanine(966)-N(2))-methyltransferase RsmD [Roseovarius phycicola]|uniref:16S rRNA (Guanine(966)-N(2))-methyltransferase RsmD n=1 Tax=Roseovarius phycicola TaxID=3080976 RepID=A0ABZ2HMU0_9RHOB
MRIIGGAFRGRKLASVGKGDDAARLRPTSDRVRESLFNVLMSRFSARVEGVAVLDIFAGTGALGLEALSRGAGNVTFVENGRVAQRILRQNIALCGVETDAKLISRDACKLGASDDPFDLIFLDPPYGKGLGEAAMKAAISGGWLSEDALVIWEEGGAVTVPEGLTQLDERSYGDTVIRILERS